MFLSQGVHLIFAILLIQVLQLLHFLSRRCKNPVLIHRKLWQSWHCFSILSSIWLCSPQLGSIVYPPEALIYLLLTWHCPFLGLIFPLWELHTFGIRHRICQNAGMLTHDPELCTITCYTRPILTQMWIWGHKFLTISSENQCHGAETFWSGLRLLHGFSWKRIIFGCIRPH